jgi:hypothetical protein
MRGDLRLEVLVNDQACEAHSTYTWAGGGTVLTISTVLPQRDLAIELISTYVGHPHTRTIVTHLMLQTFTYPHMVSSRCRCCWCCACQRGETGSISAHHALRVQATDAMVM